MSLTVELGQDWRAWQATEWPQISKARFSVEVVHRGAGKTVLALMRLLGWALEKPGSTSAYIGPYQKQVRAHIWPLLKKLYSQVAGASFNETMLEATLPGKCRVLCLGAENAQAIRSATLNGGVVLDEVADIGPIAYGQVIYPAMNRPGDPGKGLAIGTPNGVAGLFYELYEKAGSTPDWHRCFLPVDQSGVYTREEMARIKAEMSPEDYAQEYLCDWNAAARGSYWGRELTEAEHSNRIGQVPYDPMLKVHTSLDLGIRHAFVVWLWQVSGPQVRAIGCKAFTGSSIPEIWAELAQLKYNWGRHYAPHDSKVRELGSGKARVEIARALGWNWEIVPEIGLKSGIEATRLMIPRVWFDREGCKVGIEALKQYRPEYNDISKVYSLQPMESWANDFADAFRMFAVGQQGKMPDTKPLDYGPYGVYA